MVIRKLLRDVVLVAYFFILIFPKILFAWTTPVNISNTTGHSNYAALAVDRYGHIHVVWTDDTSGNNEILYCFFDGESWHTPVNISNDSTGSWNPKLACDTLGNPHVVWVDWGVEEGKGVPFYCHYDGVAWSTPISLSEILPHCSSLGGIDIDIDVSNDVHIVWSDNSIGNFEVYHSVYNGTSWSTPTNISDNKWDSSWSRMVIDSSGHPNVVWKNYADWGNPDSVEVFYSKYKGGSWSAPINISHLTGQSCKPKIALDSQDRPHVVWEERHGRYRVYYTHYDGSNWTVPYKLSGQTNSYGPALAIDSEDKAHVVWGGAGNEIYYTFGNDTSWSVPFDIADSSGRNCLLPDIGVDSTHLHVVWTKAIDRDRFEIYYSSHKLSGVEPHSWRPFPKGYRLEQCYPNPFNANTAIGYQLSAVRPRHTALKIYNIRGEEVITLVDQEQRAGRYQVVWDGRNNQGKEVTSGVYFYRLKVQGDRLKVTKTRKMVLLR